MMMDGSYGPLAARVCPLCGDSRRDALLGGQYYTRAPRDVMAVVECRCCAMMFTDPIPTAAWNETFLVRNYAPDQHAWMDRDWQEQHELPKFIDGLRLLRRLAASGRLLDVGTGPGLFVELARKDGYDAVGIDLLAQVGERRDRLIVKGTTADLPSEAYDIVTLWCVVAHEPGFLDLLRECCRVLRPGGIVLIETPNMSLWRILRPPRAALEYLTLRHRSHDAMGAYGHINHFTTRTLTTALKRCGFDALESHSVRGYGETSPITAAKRLLFRMSGGHLNFCHPLVMTASKAEAP